MKCLLTALSKLPFPVLHRISDSIAFFLYRVLKYRRKTVRENLLRAFPEMSEKQRLEIERDFYANFSDILIESIKNFSITEAELRSRCRFVNPEVAEELWNRRVNVAGISSHLANWEILALSLSLEFKHHCFGVYKPLANAEMDQWIKKSRTRFGIHMIPIKAVRQEIAGAPDKPWLLGLLSDQAPHDYEKAFRVTFLGQPTYVVPGPGLLTLEYGLVPIWGWMRRVGRSRFEWGVEILSEDPSGENWTDEDRAQIERLSRAHATPPKDIERALVLIRRYSERLEQKIREAPAEWLWSHRRWKSR